MKAFRLALLAAALPLSFLAAPPVAAEKVPYNPEFFRVGAANRQNAREQEIKLRHLEERARIQKMLADLDKPSAHGAPMSAHEARFRRGQREMLTRRLDDLNRELDRAPRAPATDGIPKQKLKKVQPTAPAENRKEKSE